MSAPAADQPVVRDDLERGRAEIPPDEPVLERDGTFSPPPPRDPPRAEFPRFRGGDGDRLPSWKRWLLFVVMLLFAGLAGFAVGRLTRVIARGLEAGER